MTLRRKYLVRNLVLLAALAGLGAVCVWGLLGVRHHLDTVSYVYDQLSSIETAEANLAAVENVLLSKDRDAGSIDAALGDVIDRMERFANPAGADAMARAAEPSGYSGERLAAAGVLARVKAVRAKIGGEAGAPLTDADAASLAAEVRSALQALHGVVSQCGEVVMTAQQEATAQLRLTMIVVALLSAGILLAAVISSIMQYRAVMLPLTRLRGAVAALASGELSRRCETSGGGDPELLALAHDFNRMAGELDDFYQRLEQKVTQTSKELARSERLASVGFLAAGVAHEINNPLNIISGYAELSLKRLRAEPDDAGVVEAERALEVIRDEAFRCKQITEKLLSLSRGGGAIGGTREPFSLAHVAEDVTGMLIGLKNYRDRRVELKLDKSEPLTVLGSPDEMKQVILNLAVNALEAVSPGVGEVSIDARRRGGWVELSVRDNGRGMASDVVDHVFEPFFTAKRGVNGGGGAGNGKASGNGVNGASRDGAGTGLGLSITHAIVTSHGGEIHAESEGPGHGSRFTVRLPAATTPAQSATDE